MFCLLGPKVTKRKEQQTLNDDTDKQSIGSGSFSLKSNSTEFSKNYSLLFLYRKRWLSQYEGICGFIHRGFRFNSSNIIHRVNDRSGT